MQFGQKKTVNEARASRFARFSRLVLCAVFVMALTIFAVQKRPAAFGCSGCVPWDTRAAVRIIEAHHVAGEATMMQVISLNFAMHRTWFTNVFFKSHVLPALMMFTEQMTAVAMQQAMAIGMMIDAKQQMETQRAFQELMFQAHKDYQPSQDFCVFGTGARSLAATEHRGRVNAHALAARQLERHLGVFKNASAEAGQDINARWLNYTQTYCDPGDNNWRPERPPSGLQAACLSDPDPERVNNDIDFKRLVDAPSTIDVDFAGKMALGGNGTPPKLDADDLSPEEEDILALGNNLYGHEVLSRGLNPQTMKMEDLQYYYMNLRSVAAKRSVAENSYTSIVGLKSSGTPDADDPQSNYQYLANVLRALGVNEDNILEMLGTNPSYYAQLEILAKRIYQNPTFFASLYDTPANVDRQGVALRAIELMLDRAIYESQLRQEMVMSVLLSTQLRKRFEAAKEAMPTGG